MSSSNPDSAIDIRKPETELSFEPQVSQDIIIGKQIGNIEFLDQRINRFPYKDYELLSNLTYDQLQTNPILDIAARVWDEERYEAAKTCYRSMRIIDDLVDKRKTSGTLTDMEKQQYATMIKDWVRGIVDNKPRDSEQKELLKTINKFQIPLWPWKRFANAIIYDTKHDGFKTFQAFLKYAEGAAISPASIFMHLCGAIKNNGSYHPPKFDIRNAARPAALFAYLVHIIRDFQKDQKDNLNYFSEDLMNEYGLNSLMVSEIAKGGEINSGFRSLVNRYYKHADHYRKAALQSIEITGPHLETRYILSLEIIYELYNQIFERIDVTNGRFTTIELNPSSKEIEDRLNHIISNNIV